MANTADLSSQLRALKLSGMLDTLDLRLQEAEQGQLSLTELLTMLFSDELEARQNRKLARLIKHARLNSGQTMESFDFNIAVSASRPQIRDLATCRYIQRAENVFFLGPTGTGKRIWPRPCPTPPAGATCLWSSISFPELFTALAKADLTGSADRLLRALCRSDLVVLDEFAFKRLDQKSAEWLYMIVDSRYSTGSIILTSNDPLTTGLRSSRTRSWPMPSWTVWHTMRTRSSSKENRTERKKA